MISKETTVGSIVSDDFRTANIFSKYNIDFCCGGNQTIQSACIQNNIDFDNLINELKQVKSDKKTGNIDFKSWPIDLLVDFIEKTYHRKTTEQIPEIKKYLEKLSGVHEKTHPELQKVRDEFFAAADSISEHMQQEERVLFPYVRKITPQNELLEDKENQIVQQELPRLISDHDKEGERFKKISSLTNNYKVPNDVCTTYEICMLNLKNFEKTLHEHIHLENNILFKQLSNLY